MKASIILLIAICGLTKALIREHFYLSISKNWTNAQRHCRKYYEDLSTITSEEEQDMLIQLAGGNQNLKWIGLYRNKTSTNNWLWSDKISVSFTDWDKGQPNNVNGSQNCVSVINKWNDYFCDSSLPFFCTKTKFILVKENKTWEEALQYCRTHHTDLASITTERQLQLIKNETRETQTESVWTGLRYLAGEWFWVGNEALREQISLPECPAQPCRCGARNTKTDKWENRDCAENLNFICN
ncbi:macrophage mannose receptor 1-like protein [Labeo rohita]|uniref:Macrophage mannose receptor 1-like protein n=2 Tax=Labeo rohita TaxID=84645 RepID=A0A498MX56_LABRO|nr:Aggrecan core protein [Labeo rohita]RXN24423.1 macrophage mannose receptor 1-like protein [Labeo rohita]